MSRPHFEETVKSIEGNIQSHEENLENLKEELGSRRDKLNFMALDAENETLKSQVRRLEKDLELKNKEINDSSQEIYSLKAIRINLETELYKNQARATAYEGLSKAVLEHERSIVTKQLEIDRLTAMVTEERENRKTQGENNELLVGQLNEKLEVLENAVTEKLRLNELLETGNEQRKELEKSLEDLTQENRELSEVNYDLKLQLNAASASTERIGGLEESLEELNSTIKAREKEVLDYREALEDSEKNNQSLLRALDDSEKTYNHLGGTLSVLKEKCAEINRKFNELSIENNSLKEELSRLQETLNERIREVENLQCEIKRVREEELITLRISVLDTEPAGDLYSLRNNNEALKRELAEKKNSLKTAWTEKCALKHNLDSLNEELKSARSELRSTSRSLSAKVLSLEEQHTAKELQNQGLIDRVNSLLEKTYNCEQNTKNLKILEEEGERLKGQIEKQNTEIHSYNEAALFLREENEELAKRLAKSETTITENQNKINELIRSLEKNTSELIKKDQEATSLIKQLDRAKRKLIYSISQLKKISSEQLEQQQKKITNYEAQINMLKDMIKSVQNELKNKQKEVIRYKKNSPSPKNLKRLIDYSPEYTPSKQKDNQQLHRDDSGYHLEALPRMKQPHSNIFKSTTPAKYEKTPRKFDKSTVLSGIIRGFLTSYVLCEKEKEELTRKLNSADLNHTGVLTLDTILGICKEEIIDTRFIEGNSGDIEYLTFVRMVYENNLRQIFSELDRNFNQLIPGTLSVSQLKLMSQGLRPVQRQIWNVVVERIQQECPLEVEFAVIKSKLTQVSISL